MSDSALTDQEFERLADAELNRLIEALIACSELLDPDLESGVLNINFDDDTKYVVNSHRAAKQIWMAAARRAWHFDYVASTQKWVASKSSDELWSALAEVLSAKLGTAIALS
jgi:CyaY protein